MIQPPTDNLYKFLAIFGLVVFGFGCYLPLQKLESLDSEVAKWRSAWGPMITRLEIQNDWAREDLDCAIDYSESKRLGSAPSDHCVKAFAARDKREADSRELQIAVDALKSDQYRLDFLQGQYVLWRNIGIAAALLGIVCSAAGFWLWYVRVQRPIDLAGNKSAERK